MIPTLSGRYQTRIFLVVVIGVIWTAIITPFLPADRSGRSFTDVAGHLYPATFLVLAIVLVVSLLLWEWLYYILQTCRWEKDWPAIFFMVELVPEAIVAYIIFRAIGLDTDGVVTTSTFVVHIVTTWIVMWLFVLGPIKIFMPRWRFNGGRIFW